MDRKIEDHCQKLADELKALISQKINDDSKYVRKEDLEALKKEIMDNLPERIVHIEPVKEAIEEVAREPTPIVEKPEPPKIEQMSFIDLKNIFEE